MMGFSDAASPTRYRPSVPGGYTTAAVESNRLHSQPQRPFQRTEVNRGAFAASAASGGARHSSCGPSAPLIFLVWQSGDPRIHEMKCRMSDVVHGWARTLLVAAA